MVEKVRSADGVFRFRSLPAGRHVLWLAKRGHEPLGPIPFRIARDRVEKLELRFERVLPVLCVAVTDVEGRPARGGAFEVFMESGARVRGFGEGGAFGSRFAFRSWSWDTMGSDGRAYVPLPSGGSFVVELRLNNGLSSYPVERRRIRIGESGLWVEEFILRWQIQVTYVEDESPVFRAGMRFGDVIRRWDNRVPTKKGELVVGSKMVPVVVFRDGRERHLRLPPRSKGFGVNWMPIKEGY